jgi:hypothetical protein
MKNLNSYIDAQMSALWAKHGCFFAFGEKQFNEQKKEGVKYCSPFNGMACPVDNVNTMLQEMEEIHTSGIKQDIEENGIEAIIKRELYNYEAFYTGDLEETINALESYNITPEQVREVYRNELSNVEF